MTPFPIPVSTWRTTALCAVLVILASPVIGQQYLYQHFNERDGLINNAVNDMTQGPDGRMWFATRGGIVSYDGQEWVTQGPAQGIGDKEFGHIVRADNGTVWAISKQMPFRTYYLEGDTWDHLPVPPVPRLTTFTSVLAVDRMPDGSPLLAFAQDAGNLCFWYHDQWHPVPDPAATADIVAFDFFEGRLLASTGDNLLAIDPLTLEISLDPFPSLPESLILALAVDPTSGDCWFVGSDWIGRLSRGDFILEAADLAIAAGQRWNRTGSLADGLGGLYFGGLARSYYYHPNLGLEELTRNTGLQSSGATDFFLDREGNAWICGLRGVSRLVSRRFAGMDRFQGLLEDEVAAVLEDSRGRIILGQEKGLTIIGPGGPEPFSFGLPPGVQSRVMGLAEDSHGNIWAPSEGVGLVRISPDGELSWFGPEQGISLRPFSIHIDPWDRIWIGSDEGLALGDGHTFLKVSVQLKDGDSLKFVRSFFPASDGSLYLATGRNGVVRYHEGEISQWKGANMSEGSSTFAVFETDDHRFWAGSSIGLRLLKGERLPPTVWPDPVIDRPVYCIEKDASGRVWFGTDAGVYIWDGTRLVHYSVEEGLIGPEINRAGLVADSSGRMWVGTDRGVSIYNPDLDRLPPVGPRLKIMGYDVDGSVLPPDAPLHLERPPGTLTVRFMGISFTDERNLGFRTWLENYEPGWSTLSSRPISEVRYTNLPAGNYRFHVQAEASDGRTSEIIVSPAIHIDKELKDRWWVSALALILVTGTGYLLISFWEGQRHARRLEAEVQVRTSALEASEKTVRSESQRLSATLGNILDGVLALDQDDRVVLCNPAAEKILNRPASEIVGRALDEVLPLAKENTQLNQEALDWNCQDQLECPDRGTVCLEVSSSTIVDESGERTGRVVAFSDITDRLRMEREIIRTQKLESLGLLAGGIAHDFNNLLTIILGNIDMVEGVSDLDEMNRESLLLAKDASRKARTLTGQLLTFAKGGAPQRKPQTLHEIVGQSVALSFSGLNLHCRVDLPADLWLVDVDAGQMAQVFNNLLINAAQAMDQEGSVRISAQNLDPGPPFLEPGPWVRVDIRDEGCGIPEKNLTRIFDPYFTTKNSGSGLGLATSYSIINRHDGKILVDSRVGHGSTFSIYLPRAGKEQVPDEVGEGPPQIRGGRILVLEDEEGIHRVLKGFLKRLEMEGVFTTDGEQTVARYQEALDAGQPFDLVLTDLTILGGLGGRETLARLLEIDPEVRAIVFSGYSHEDVLADYRRFGFRGALGKPFGFEQLAQVLGQALVDRGGA